MPMKTTKMCAKQTWQYIKDSESIWEFKVAISAANLTTDKHFFQHFTTKLAGMSESEEELFLTQSSFSGSENLGNDSIL